MGWYEARSRAGSVTCGQVAELPSEYKAWVSQPAPPFAFGKFLCACLTVEEAEAIANAMNRPEDSHENCGGNI